MINAGSGTMVLASDTSYVLVENITMSAQFSQVGGNVAFDGNDHTITITTVSGFLGLFSAAVTVHNLGILHGTSTLASGAGWFFANSTGGTATNCYSTGPVGQDGGGIFGKISTGTAHNCYSMGDISNNGGGIFGRDGNNVTATNCYSIGSIGQNGGGIFGTGCSIVTATNCYSVGLTGTNAGGIFGLSCSSITDVSSGFSVGWYDYIANIYLTEDPSDNVTGFPSTWAHPNDISNIPYALRSVKLPQIITFDMSSNKIYGDASFALVATADSSLPITYDSSNVSVATIVGGKVIIVGVGTTAITANQVGNSTYNANLKSLTLTISKKVQVITFDQPTDKTYGDASFALVATVNSDLAVSYDSSNVSVAKFVGGKVVIVGAGTTSITVTQGGDANHISALAISHTFTVNKKAQIIAFDMSSNKIYGDASFALVATADSDLDVSYDSSNTAVATIVGGKVVIVGGGSTLITAKQAGNTNYIVAPNVTHTLTIGKKAQVITFAQPFTPFTKTYGDASFALVATANSDLAVSYDSSNTAVATIVGGKVVIVGGGSTLITAKQAGNANYLSATVDISHILIVNKKEQVIAFAQPLAKKIYQSFTLGATSTNLTTPIITYTSSNTTVATILGNIATMVSAGLTTITASQEGNNKYIVAPSVARVLTVEKLSQTITFTLQEIIVKDVTITLDALSDRTLTVLFSTTSQYATINTNNNTITFSSTGVFYVTASQAGNDTYNAATPVIRQITVTSNNNVQILTMAQPSNKFVNDSLFNLNAHVTSGGQITYDSSNTAVATVDSFGQVTIIGLGYTDIVANCAAFSTFTVASPVTRRLYVTKRPQLLTVGPLFDTMVNKVLPFTVVATSNNLTIPITYASSNAAVATMDGSNIVITGPGSTTIMVSQAGDGIYSVAQSISKTLNIIPINTQTITFNALSPKLISDATFNLTSSTSSGNPVTYISSNTAVATILGATVTILSAGSTDITATCTTTGGYSTAPSVTISLIISKQPQVLTFNALPPHTGTTGTIVLSATSTSLLPITYASSNTDVATIAGSTVTITGPGSTFITASQAGNTIYNDAVPVKNTLLIIDLEKIVPTINAYPFASKIKSGLTVSCSTLLGGSMNALVKGKFIFSSPTDIINESTFVNVSFIPDDTITYSIVTDIPVFIGVIAPLTVAEFIPVTISIDTADAVSSTLSSHTTEQKQELIDVAPGKTIVLSAELGRTILETAPFVSQVLQERLNATPPPTVNICIPDITASTKYPLITIPTVGIINLVMIEFAWYTLKMGSNSKNAMYNSVDGSLVIESDKSYYISVSPAPVTRINFAQNLGFDLLTLGAIGGDNGTAVSITSVDVSSNSYVGDNVKFKVHTAGDKPITYQWFKDSVKINGANDSSYNIAHVSVGDAGRYRVDVSNAYADVSSSQYWFHVPATIIAPFPSDLTIALGSTDASFNVAVSGENTLTYAWKKNDVTINGEISNSLILTKNDHIITLADAGTYMVTVSNGHGVPQTRSIKLNIQATIINNLEDKTVLYNNPVTFSIDASSSGIISYQWYKGNTLIPGKTLSTYTIPNTRVSDASEYYVSISDEFVKFNSLPSTLHIATNITYAPVGVTTFIGSDVSFNVGISGEAGTTYQWFHGTTPMPGQRNAKLTLNNIAIGDAGYYHVDVSNAYNTVDVSHVPVRLNIATDITTQPVSVTTVIRHDVSFNVDISGEAGTTYQWFHGTTLIPGEISAKLSLNDIDIGDAGYYHVDVSNQYNSVAVHSSSNVRLNIATNITSAPVGVTSIFGSDVSFNVGISGENTGLNYQWFHGTKPIPGQKSAKLTLIDIKVNNAGYYHVDVSNAYNTVDVSHVPVRLNIAAKITVAPVAISCLDGSDVQFSVGASGEEVIHYQWYDASGAIAGKTSNKLTFTNVDNSYDNMYYVGVSNEFNAREQQSTHVPLIIAPKLVSNLLDVTVAEGEDATFKADVSGATGYKWYIDTDTITPLQDSSSTSFTVSKVKFADAGKQYFFVAADADNDTVTSNFARLNIKASMGTLDIVGATKIIDDSYTFSVGVSGETNTLKYQWFHDGLKLAGKTGATLTLNPIIVGDAGNYRVDVSNQYNHADVSSSTVRLNIATKITTQPAMLTTFIGRTDASFNVGISGEAGTTYQWFHNNNILDGETGAKLSLGTIAIGDAGYYHVDVSNQYNSVAVHSSSLIRLNIGTIVTTPPVGVTAIIGNDVSFNVGISGEAGATYQWFHGTTKLTSQKGAILTLTDIKVNNAGYYHVDVSNAYNKVDATHTPVRLNIATKITTQPVGITSFIGSDVSFNVGVSGENTGLKYQWFNGTTLLPGQIGAKLSLTSITLSNAGDYRVDVSNQYNHADVSSSTVRLNIGASVLTDPSPITKIIGDVSASFTVVPQGENSGDAGVFSYMWKKNGGIITPSNHYVGINTAKLTINTIVLGDADNYTVDVSNNYNNGSNKPIKTSKNARLNIATKITTQPVGVTSFIGSDVSFNVGVSGEAGTTYQWFHGTTKLSKGAKLSLSSITLSDAGNYRVDVSNQYNHADVSSSTVRLNIGASVLTDPSPITKIIGDVSASFTVVPQGENSGGAGAYYYKWKKNGGIITPSSHYAGINTAKLTINTIVLGDADNYTVDVSNNYNNGSNKPIKTSKNARLNIATKITTQPVGVTSFIGSDVSFNVGVSGEAGTTYQWFHGTTKLTSQKGAKLSLTSINSTHVGDYRVDVSNQYNHADVSSSTVRLNIGASVLTNPITITKFIGDVSASFTVVPQGENTGNAGAYNYKWKKDGVDIPAGPHYNGINAATLIINNLVLGDKGYYTVDISNNYNNGSNKPIKTSNKVRLNIGANILTDPVTAIHVIGDNHTFTVVAQGETDASAGAYKYRWKKDGGTIQPSSHYTGINAASLTLNKIVIGDAGYYTVDVSNNYNNGNNKPTKVSKSVRLNIGASVLTNPTTATHKIGENHTFTVVAQGEHTDASSGVYKYQWYKAGAIMTGEISNNLILDNIVVTNAANYKVEVYNKYNDGTAGKNARDISNNARLNVATKITTQPVGVTSFIGGDVSFNVDISGEAGTTYQWFHNGLKMVGKTATKLTLSAIVIGDAGNYRVDVSNQYNHADVSSSTVRLNIGASVFTDPSTITKFIGDVSASFTVVPQGENITNVSAYNYKWKKDGVDIQAGPHYNGINAATLIINNLVLSDKGYYTVDISNNYNNGSNKPIKTSNKVRLNIGANILTDPATVIHIIGENHTFTVVAQGETDASAGAYQYRWKKDGVDISANSHHIGPNTDSLTINKIVIGDAGYYTVDISNNYNNGNNKPTKVSKSVRLNIGATILTNPIDATHVIGEDHTFTVVAQGEHTDASSGAYQYQWYKAGDKMTGEISNNLILNNISVTNAANYTVEVYNKYNDGSAGKNARDISNNARLNIAASIVTQPVLQNKTTTQAASFTVECSGELTNFAYKWEKSTDKGVTYNKVTSGIASSTNKSTLSISSVALTDAALYRVDISNAHSALYGKTNPDYKNGVAVSKSVILEISPRILKHPVSTLNTFVGGEIRLTSDAEGQPTMVYKWKKDGVPLSDVTGRIFGTNTKILYIINNNIDDAGLYKVYITNGISPSIDTSNCTVTVTQGTTTGAISSGSQPIGNIITYTNSAGTTLNSTAAAVTVGEPVKVVLATSELKPNAEITFPKDSDVAKVSVSSADMIYESSGVSLKVELRAFDSDGTAITVFNPPVVIYWDLPASFVSKTVTLSRKDNNGVVIDSQICTRISSGIHINQYMSIHYHFSNFEFESESNVPCFPSGTRILTTTGYKAVEDLDATDYIKTADGRSVKFNRYTTVVKRATTHSAPFMIPANTFGKNSPPHAINLSPLHAIQSKKGIWQIPKYAALSHSGIKQYGIGESVTYYHIELPNYFKDNIVAEGAIVESFGGKQTKGLGNVYKYNTTLEGFTRISSAASVKKADK